MGTSKERSHGIVSHYFTALPGLGTNSIDSYEHKITGTRNSCKPRETIGGILADEMGLGKTLTVLSAIVGSMDLAASSTIAGLHAEMHPRSHLPRVKATLVIVPSVCKFE